MMRGGAAETSRGAASLGGARNGSARGEKGEAGVVNLMPRDLHLLAAVGTARYLSTQQIAELFFQGRTYKNALRRLRQLELASSGGGSRTRNAVRVGGYLRSVDAVSYAGDRVEAWTVTQRGATAVAAALGLQVIPVERVLSAQFVAHQVRLADVFVGLVRRCASMGGAMALKSPRKGVRANDFPRMRLGFRWMVAEAARLPWREFDVKGGAARDRYIAPDATLEVGGRRVFIEMETGAHPISSANPSRRGATAQKLAAYDSFIGGYEGIDRKRTFYDVRFGDSLSPEVLFVVESETRAANVGAMIAEHRAGASRGASAKAMVVDEAVAYLAGLAGASPAASPHEAEEDSSEAAIAGGAALTAEEVTALQNLYVAYNGWRRAEKEARRVVPRKPADLAVAYAALKRLRLEFGLK